MALTPASNRQVPDHSIMDLNGKQVYLGNQYSVSLASTIGTSETPILLMRNSQVLNSQGIGLFQNLLQVASLTALNAIILRVYVSPTVTGNGTPATPKNSRPASSQTSIATITSAPTVSANGTLVSILSAQPLTSASSNLLMVIDGGQSLLVTVVTGGVGTSVNTVLGWYEI